MPNPLIILNNHLKFEDERFLIDNMGALKEMGYSTVLLEMDDSFSPQAYKAQCYQLMQMYPKGTVFHSMGLCSYQLLSSIEAHQMKCVLIDPETQAEGLAANQKIQAAAMHSPQALAYATQERERSTAARDVVMARRIREHAALTSGGVISLVGFLHVNLITLLQQDLSRDYQYVVFGNSNKSATLDRAEFIDANASQWDRLPHRALRHSFYKAPVHFIDAKMTPSFEEVQQECQLSAAVEIPTPSIPAVALYFNTLMQKAFTFSRDSRYVVTGSILCQDPVEESQLDRALHAYAPALSFSKRVSGHVIQLQIIGLNMPEQSSQLRQAFVSHGIMQESTATKPACK